ncbi:head completion/stabilization protein [Novosphingobium pituita]|uniref:Head completion/stabilization protein n=1 Tax=Novosphingobium pituita TaxID=3056842 RepID=A0ABQ6P3U1_9SPHN|nr:head completion/stabilization protein [Novosphingobium sp. IK01]GMM59871.1 head completion/stabilization protein [Novosphingobium sp. IK01]
MSSTPLVIAPVPLASAVGTVLSGDGWWPDIDCNDMREALRIGEAVTHARLIMALEGAMITVTDDLAPWRAAQEAAGFTSLAAVRPAQMTNGKPRLVVLFTNAVRYGAAAELFEHSTDMTATGAMQGREEAKRQQGGDFDARRLQAVRSIMGTTRVAVALL